MKRLKQLCHCSLPPVHLEMFEYLFKYILKYLMVSQAVSLCITMARWS